MSTTAPLALTGAEAAFFTLPPRRPRTTNRRDGAGVLARLIGAVRRELADAASRPGLTGIPRVRNYPY
jgi:hypothetical protein